MIYWEFFLTEINLGLNCLQNRLLHNLFQGWVEPPTTRLSLWLSPHQPTVHPMVEGPEGPDHLGRQDPCIRPVYQVVLYHGILEQSADPHVCPLPPQDPQYLRPPLLHLTQILNHLRLVIISHHDQPTQVFEV